MQDIDHYVARKLRYYRNKMNWPLKTLASKLGISLQQLQRYENCTNKISAGMLYQLAEMLKIDVMCFFDGYQKETQAAKDDRYKILLIEDNADDEFFFRKSIESFSKDIDVYVLKDEASVSQFFRSLQEQGFSNFLKPDIIFLDLNLPSLKGFDVLQDIKKRPLLHSIPVIILTSSINEEDISKSYHLQASGYIRKSFLFQDFCEQIHRTLSYWIDIVRLPMHLNHKKAG
jgi:CheY-like chemotaxis protein/DNA-binding XRE family transcriptional regulator